MIQALIYRRFSTDEQEAGSTDTLSRQLERCQAFAAARGWEVVDVITDKGRSAFKGEHLRPDAALGQFVEEVQAGTIARGTVLIAERLDRLSRRPVDETMAWIHTLTTAGVEIALADTAEVFRPGDMGSFLTTAIRAALGHEESRKKSDLGQKAKAKLWQMANDRVGAWTNFAARHPSWLRRNEAGDGWLIDEHRADVVRSIFSMAADDGLGTTAIAQRLNAASITPFAAATRYKNGIHTWGASSVRQILASPNAEGDWTGATGPYAGRTIVGFYPRIVDADLVARARGETASRQRFKGERGGSTSSNLFSRQMRCGHCGRRAFSYSTLKKGRSYAYVRCEAAGQGRCNNTGGYAYAKFEATFLDVFLDLALDDRYFEAGDQLKAARIQIAELEKTIADKSAARSRLLTVFAAGDDDHQLIEMIEGLKAEIDRLRSDLGRVNKAAMAASGRVSSVEHLRRVQDIREAADSSDQAIRGAARSKLRSALAGIIEQVEIERDDEGAPFFTVILRGAVMAVRIDTKGRVLRAISDVQGQPLYKSLSEGQQEALAPLIARIEKLAV